MRVPLLLAAFALSTATHAATLTAERTVDGQSAIRLSGLIAEGDEAAFMGLMAGRPRPQTLILSGDGGNALEAMKMGELARGLRTVVPTGHNCLSSCALLWLAGKTRVRESPSDVGFHAVSVRKEGVDVVSAPGNALVGAYLLQLGFGPTTIVYMTSAAPNRVQWLFPEDRKRYGIAYDDAAPASIAALDNVTN